MKSHTIAALAFLSCLSFAAQAKLSVKNELNKDVYFNVTPLPKISFGAIQLPATAGHYGNAGVKQGSTMEFSSTPKTMSMRPAGGMWFPLETYLAKLYFAKKSAKSDTGYLTIKPKGDSYTIAISATQQP